MDNLKQIDDRLANIETMLLNTKTVLTFDEAAIYTGLSKSYLYKLTSNRGVPCYKPGGKILYFNRAELDAWMMQNRRATDAELETQANTYMVVKGG
jgi:excisionase family DNA binding protein